MVKYLAGIHSLPPLRPSAEVLSSPPQGFKIQNKKMDEISKVFEIHYSDEKQPRVYLLYEAPEVLNLTILGSGGAKLRTYPLDAKSIIVKTLEQSKLLQALKEITDVNQSRSKQIA